MKAKRSLGQNFFVNENLGKHISNLISDVDCDSVIEIGPGMGFFTEILAKNFKNVIVVEKDYTLAERLETQFPQITVFKKDFLDIDIESIVKEETCFFGSLPFNVSKPIIRKIIQNPCFTKESLFIVQKEVAQKYLYRRPYSALSLTTSIYAQSKKILDISPQSFKPKPNVTSSLISFLPSRKELVNTKLLEELINTSFKQPRKTLGNNLKGTRFEKWADEHRNLRPADLGLEEYIKIYEYLL